MYILLFFKEINSFYKVKQHSFITYCVTIKAHYMNIEQINV